MNIDKRVAELLKALEPLAGDPGACVSDPVEARKQDELRFHDMWRDRDVIKVDGAYKPDDDFQYGNEKYYVTTQASKSYLETWLNQNVRGKIFLDYACGNGYQTMAAARSGAALAIGIDLSGVSVANARRAAEHEGLNNTLFLQADCEKTGFPDECVDVVLCSGMLHHLDLEAALPEIKRILIPDGKVFCMEALAYNPVIRFYRKLTPGLRTEFEAEHILGMRDVRLAKRFFLVEDMRFWHLFSIGAVIFRKTSMFHAVLRLADMLDRIVLKVYPLSLLAWQFSFVLRKAAGDDERHGN